MAVVVLDFGDQLAYVGPRNFTCVFRSHSCLVSSPLAIFFANVVFTLIIDVLNSFNSAVHECLLGQQSRENQFSVVDVNSVQIFRFDLLLWNDVLAIKHPKLRYMVNYLQTVVLFVLDRVETQVKFGQLRQQFNELQLKHLLNLVQRQSQKSE